MKRPERKPAWVPVDYTAAVVEAVQAVSRGEANEAQQKLAMRWIVQDAAGTYEPSFYSDADGGDRETAFAEGRRFVGLQLVKLINLTGGAIKALREGPKNADD